VWGGNTGGDMRVNPEGMDFDFHLYINKKQKSVHIQTTDEPFPNSSGWEFFYSGKYEDCLSRSIMVLDTFD
jgi:hypothetical protein